MLGMTMSEVPIGLVFGGGSKLQLVSRELNTVVDRLFAPFGLTTQQAAVVLHAAGGATSPNQLAAAVATDTAGMTRLLDRLETKGFLARQKHPEDRRAVVVELTGEGRALVPRLAPVFGRAAGQLLAGFSTAELDRLNGMLDRMLANLRVGVAG